jgi:hypothetical protein
MGRRVVVDQLAGATAIGDLLGVSNGQVTDVRRGGWPGETAEMQRKLEHSAWKLACCAETFGVTAGDVTP